MMLPLPHNSQFPILSIAQVQKQMFLELQPKLKNWQMFLKLQPKIKNWQMFLELQPKIKNWQMFLELQPKIKNCLPCLALPPCPICQTDRQTDIVALIY